ncbi:MAG: hypothetical protein SOW11_02635, partial [Campylobacter lanienae]|nr:hypothetical protein [Campylobacter lanienae]
RKAKLVINSLKFTKKFTKKPSNLANYFGFAFWLFMIVKLWRFRAFGLKFKPYIALTIVKN